MHVRADRTWAELLGSVTPGVREGLEFTDQPDVSLSGRAIPAFTCDPQRVGVLAELENRQTPEYKPYIPRLRRYVSSRLQNRDSNSDAATSASQ